MKVVFITHDCRMNFYEAVVKSTTLATTYSDVTMMAFFELTRAFLIRQMILLWQLMLMRRTAEALQMIKTTAVDNNVSRARSRHRSGRQERHQVITILCTMRQIMSQ